MPFLWSSCRNWEVCKGSMQVGVAEFCELANNFFDEVNKEKKE
jgi:hypothetical protein